MFRDNDSFLIPAFVKDAIVNARPLREVIATPLDRGARITTAHRLPADAAPSLHSSDPQA